MGNKKVLSKATRELNKTKRVAAPKNIIEDPRGQWAHPGEITRIPSDKITMQGVPYPVMAYPNMGEPQMMYPGGEYYFPGADYVDEYPELKKGGTPKSLVKMPKPSKKGLASKKFSRSLEATNRLFTENPLFAKPKSKKRKVFDPNAQYQDGGVISQEEVDAANNAMMKARLAYAQMHGNPAAQRMVVAPDQPYVYTGEEYDKDWDMPVGVPAGETGTHYMASFGNYAVPFIQQGPNGLQFNESPSIRDREAIRFDSEADAEYFGGHYKEVAPDKSYRRKIENGSPYISSLSPEDEEQFQRFYNTLPENLQSDDPSYDIRGYWDSEGRPEEFDYSQPKEDDGYYHAYSINQNTGEYLKNPWHPTFQHAIDEDKKIGYRPVVNVKGELIATENPSIADPEEQTFLRNTEGPANYVEAELTPEEIEEYRKGGFIVEDISVPSLNQMQTGGDASCPPGYVKIGGKCVPTGNQPTFQDSLDVYNMQMKQNAYYDKHKKFFKNQKIHKSPIAIEVYTDDLSSGKTRRESIDALRKEYNLQKDTYNFYVTNGKVPSHMRGKEKEKWEKAVKKNIAESKKKMQQIRSGIEEHYPSRNNKHYYKDLITGAIDPNAPTSYYHDQIKPQGLIERDSNKHLGKLFDGIDVTTVYYDPLAIKPAKLLSDEEIKKRYEKYGESGIPESRLKRLNLTEKKPTVQQQTTTKKPIVQQYPKEYKPVVNNLPPGVSKSQLEKAGVIIGDKAIVGYEEVQQLDPTTGTVKTVVNPVYSDIEKPIPTLHPTRVNPTIINGELQRFVGEEREPGTGTDVMPVYDTDELPMYATPDGGAEWVGKTERYIDWDGNSVGYNLPRVRKPGHGGDLIRKGKRRYLHFPSIESRYQAEIVPEEEYQDGGSTDPKTNFYTVEGSGGVYRKVNGKWEVDWNRSGNFQPLSKGDVAKRTAILNSQAKPLYDATYDDIYTTQNTAYTAPPKASAVKPTATKKPTAQDKAAQEQFDKAFAVPIKSKKEIIEDKIQKGIDDYVKYHQQQTGKPLTQEEYDDAYQDIYNRAYTNAGVYSGTTSGPVANPYGTTELRKNLVSLDPGKAPKNLTLGDYVDKGWDIVTNPLDYASYALKPKGTVTTPWNMTNYENRLEAAGLEDPVTANNNVNKAIDFASYFIGPGMVAQGLKMIPGTVNSIGRAFENPSWENTGDAVWDASMTALSIAPGFGIAKNLGKPASTIDDLKAIEALRGNTATTPFQSYYLTGNRALNASEATIPQAQALRRFIDPQSPQLPAGRSPIMSEGTRTQLTNPAVDSYFPVRFGDESYAAAGNEQYFVDPQDYRIFNPETQQYEINPNWKQEGLTDYWNYPNREGNRGTGPDFFKGIDYEFKDFSPGWQAARDAKDLIMPAQRMPKRSDYFTRSEFYDMLEQEMRYKILDDERKIQEALTGKKFTDAEFAEMNPGVTRPDFTKKMLTEEHRRAVNDLLRDNPSVKSNPLLKENLEAAVARSERRENALPISVTIRQDLEKYPPETLINLYGKQYAGVLPEQIASLSPKQLEKTKQTIIDRIAKGMSKAEEDFAKNNPFRPGDNPMSLNLAADTPGQLPSLTRTPKEMKAIDDLRKLHSRTRTGQSNAEDVFNRLKTQKLKDLDTPDGRRRIQEHIDDNNIMKSDYVKSNYDEISKRYDLRDILTNPNHEKHQVAVEGLKEELIRKGKNPSDYKLNSWDELTGDAVLSNMRLYLDADEVVAKSYPDYFGGFIERPITTDEYIDRIKLLDYSNPEKNIKLIENKIASEGKRISKVKAKKDELLKDYRKGDVSLDRYRRIKSEQEAEILRAEQEIISMEMTIDWLKKDLERSNASYNVGPHTIEIGDPLTAIGDLERAVYHETGHGTDLAFLKNEKEGSKIDRDLLDEIVLAKEAPAHITQKLDLDAMSQASPYTTSKFSISKAQNPIAYWEQARNYFKGPEPTAFAVELRPLLREAGLIKNDFDKVTPEMVKELYQDYITKPVWETGTRIFDIIEPVEQSFKAISKALNKIKGMAPYAIPVGLGVGAAGLFGQEEMQQDMEYQSGGIVMELSDAEIKEYKKGGWIIEEM